MKYGVCTNQPSLCRRAAARELMPMTEPDTRCPEPGCGKPLLPAPSGSTTAKSSKSILIIAIATLLAVGGGGGYFLYHRNQQDEKTVTKINVPAKQPAIGNPATIPATTPMPSVTSDSAAPGQTTTTKISPAPRQSKDGHVAEMPKSADNCSHVNWQTASCSTIAQCWQPESASLSSCEGLSPGACSHIRSCLGVAPVDVGPGVKN
jgi:hypothetical protein